MASGTNLKETGIFVVGVSSLGVCRGLAVRLEKEGCEISAKTGSDDEGVEVAAEVIHCRWQLEQK